MDAQRLPAAACFAAAAAHTRSATASRRLPTLYRYVPERRQPWSMRSARCVCCGLCALHVTGWEQSVPVSIEYGGRIDNGRLQEGVLPRRQIQHPQIVSEGCSQWQGLAARFGECAAAGAPALRRMQRPGRPLLRAAAPAVAPIAVTSAYPGSRRPSAGRRACLQGGARRR